ncbi:MAG: hypothetical protein ACT6QU_14630 [Aliihoeflea sp.]|uniref:hypothetical protein n=1 Tax=Aliihoeflea sp. TaxID=2608088 RepID=UPI004033EA92
MTDLERLRTRAIRGDAGRPLEILSRVPDRKTDPGDELYDLPLEDQQPDDGRRDPWWFMPLALVMWALVALTVVILLAAIFD